MSRQAAPASRSLLPRWGESNIHRTWAAGQEVWWPQPNRLGPRKKGWALRGCVVRAGSLPKGHSFVGDEGQQEAGPGWEG